MSNNLRYLHCIFADDIRQEVSGKQIVVGMYQGGMSVRGPLPANLPKLQVMALLNIPRTDSVASLKLTVLMNTTVMAEIDVPRQALPNRDQTPPDLKGHILQIAIELVPFAVEGSGKLQVHALINGSEILEGNTLHITHEPDSPSEPTPLGAKS